MGGRQYESIQDELWVFALLGTVLSLLQLLIYSVLARQARGAVLLVWAAFTAVIVVGAQAQSLTGLLLSVLIVDLVLFVTLLAVATVHSRQPDPLPGTGTAGDSLQPAVQ